MIYRIAFQKRYQSDGERSALDPTLELDEFVPEGVIAEKAMVASFEPHSQHSQGVMDEDDAFLAMSAPEIWEYTVVDERREDFEAAARNALTILEVKIVDETETAQDEATGVRLSEFEGRAGDGGGGPAGASTGDPSAGAVQTGRGSVAQPDELGDLTVLPAEDPSLGLTNLDGNPEDWAADTGPTQIPDRGIETERQGDDESTLRPDR